MKSVKSEELSFKSARVRWTTFFTIVVVSIVSILCVIVFFFALRYETRSSYAGLNQMADRIATRIGRAPLITLERILRNYAENPDLFTAENEYMQFLSTSGESILQLGGRLLSVIPLKEGFANGMVVDYSDRESEYRLLTRSLTSLAGQSVVFMRVGKPVSELSNIMRNLLWALLSLVLLTAAISWIIGLALAGYVLNPFKESYQRLQRFTADASHELKTPLSIIRLGLDMLGEKELDPEVSSKIGMIDTATRNMQNLVNQLIKMARIQSSQEIKAKAEPVNIKRLLEDIALSYRPLSDPRGIEIKIECEDNLVSAVITEPLTTSLINLLENAVKFSYDGSTVVLKSFLNDGYLYIQVIDNGPGIEPVEHEKIFERFYKSERSHNSTGSGMGLAIARELVGTMKGEINLVSEPDKGSTFEIKLRAG
ncbi:MAG: HAMP domain-containing sensor histidine kinase [Mesotoga sp.]